VNEYPSDEVLEQIKTMPCDDFHAFMDFIKSHWHFVEWGWTREGNVYYLSTGGWSGNEDIIDTMSENKIFCLMYRQQSRRGWHFVFGRSEDMHREE
jgi:hypothetical protein